MPERQVAAGTTWSHDCGRRCEAYFKTEDVTRGDGQPAKRIIGSFCKCEPKREKKDGNEGIL